MGAFEWLEKKKFLSVLGSGKKAHDDERSEHDVTNGARYYDDFARKRRI
jgi:hypothetical protein